VAKPRLKPRKWLTGHGIHSWHRGLVVVVIVVVLAVIAFLLLLHILAYTVDSVTF